MQHFVGGNIIHGPLSFSVEWGKGKGKGEEGRLKEGGDRREIGKRERQT